MLVLYFEKSTSGVSMSWSVRVSISVAIVRSGWVGSQSHRK